MEKQYQIALSFATEDQDTAEKVYHYLKVEKLDVFFAPAPECQEILSGRNQREVFYEIFGLQSEYAALFVSKDYIRRPVPMEEARIAFAKKGSEGRVIPVYLDGTPLPEDLLDPGETNYFKSRDAAQIAAHLAAKIKRAGTNRPDSAERVIRADEAGTVMNIAETFAQKAVQINRHEGDIYL